MLGVLIAIRYLSPAAPTTTNARNLNYDAERVDGFRRAVNGRTFSASLASGERAHCHLIRGRGLRPKRDERTVACV
jgi:hypothetical protein